jgi:hypothetical protein
MAATLLTKNLLLAYRYYLYIHVLTTNDAASAHQTSTLSSLDG